MGTRVLVPLPVDADGDAEGTRVLVPLPRRRAASPTSGGLNRMRRADDGGAHDGCLRMDGHLDGQAGGMGKREGVLDNNQEMMARTAV